MALGLDGQFKPGSFAALRPVLEQSAAGREWLAAFEKARHPWFNVSTGTGWYHHDRSWNDDLDVPLGEEQIDEHAIVLFGVPYAQQRKHFERALSGGLARKQR